VVKLVAYLAAQGYRGGAKADYGHADLYDVTLAGRTDEVDLGYELGHYPFTVEQGDGEYSGLFIDPA